MRSPLAAAVVALATVAMPAVTGAPAHSTRTSHSLVNMARGERVLSILSGDGPPT